VATYEITNKGNGWHPHLHAIFDCRWLSLHVPEPLRTDPSQVVASKCRLAQEELSALWAKQISQKKSIVHVKRIFDPKNIAREVLKYAMKGSDLVNSPDPIAPLLRSIKGTRMLAGWGSMWPMPELDEEEPAKIACDKCHAEGSYLPESVIQYITRGADVRMDPGAMPTYRKAK
jgi:hypothetical protein